MVWLSKYAIAAAVACFMVVMVISALVWAASPPQLGSHELVQVTIEPGHGTTVIAQELKDAGLIRSTTMFVLYTQLIGVQSELKAGTYELSLGMSLGEVARHIASGDALSDDIQVTIPEGMNVWEIDSLLQTKHLIVPGSFARQWQLSEGGLFPDTYRFPHELASSSAEYINANVVGKVLADAWKLKTDSYDRQEVILASILEKEAKSADDMALVSGIMAKRMELGMPLQVDATVGYGWCLARWLPMSSTNNCDVTQAPIAAEIKKDGPYNTYTRKGLPGGPISNPGLTALKAAANPKKSEYLYYLSTRDGSQLIYGKTLQEHLENRRKYLGF